MQTTQTNVSTIGEEISYDLAAKMMKDHQDKNGATNSTFFIGKNIINRILKQPGCEGLLITRAINEEGKETIIYMGIDANKVPLESVTHVLPDGSLKDVPGIVADRAGAPTEEDIKWMEDHGLGWLWC